MPFLRVAAGESIGFEILSDKPGTTYRHWVQNMSFDCTGEGCPFCAKGMRPQARFRLSVNVNGEQYDWEFGKRVFVMLTFLSGQRPTYKGLLVQLTRIGSGLETQWQVAELTEPLAYSLTRQEQAKAAEVEELPEEVREYLVRAKRLQEMIPEVGEAAGRALKGELSELRGAIQEAMGSEASALEGIEF